MQRLRIDNSRSGNTSGSLTLRQFRSIFISDLHLGSRDCRAEKLLGFLRYCESQYLYLVGDIIDGWALRDEWFWPQSHNDVVQKLLRKARKGTRITYLTGNHDDFLAAYHDLNLGGILFARDVVHTTAAGRRLLILHGDIFDATVTRAKWLGVLGTRLAGLRARWRGWAEVCHQLVGRDQPSAAAPRSMISFQTAAEKDAKLRGADGIVCGHIHQPSLVTEGDAFMFVNCGDWTDHCTAVAEHFDGSLELIRFGDISVFSHARAA